MQQLEDEQRYCDGSDAYAASASSRSKYAASTTAMPQLQTQLTNSCCWSPRVRGTKRLCITSQRDSSAMTGVATIMTRLDVSAWAKDAGHTFSTNMNMAGMSTYELQVSTTLRQYRMQAAATARW